MNWQYIELVEFIDRDDRVEDRYRYASRVTIEGQELIVTIKLSHTLTQQEIEGAIDTIVQELDPETFDYRNIVRII
jgi:hypothetical protein